MAQIPGVEAVTADARLRGFSRQGDDGFHFPATALVSVLTPLIVIYASQAEAEAGSDNAKLMTPLRTKQAIDAQVPAIVADKVAVDAQTVTANTTFSVPSGWAIDNIYFVNTTANAVTGGIRIGTTAGGTDIVATIQVDANAIVDTFQSLDFALSKRLLSVSGATTIYVQAVTAWNSASVNIAVQRTRVF